MKSLRKALLEGSFLLDIKADSMEQIHSKICDYLVACEAVASEDIADIKQKLNKQEQASSAVLSNGMAAPHVYDEKVRKPTIVFIRLAQAINLGAADAYQTHFVFALIGPSGAEKLHFDVLTDILKLMGDSDFRYDAGEAESQLDLIQALDAFTSKEQAPAPEVKPVTLTKPDFPGKLFEGFFDDFKRRYKHYKTDFRDGLHRKSLPTILFLFFACIAPAITFGGIMAEMTNNAIGVVEMLVASVVCGCLYAVLSGQPLIILGGTGPMLIFTAILYDICIDLGLPFLPVYAWVGIWTGMFLMFAAFTNGSRLMTYFTRFTDELFLALMSLIFVYEGVKGVIHIFHEDSYDTALLSLLLAFGTFSLAMNLSAFRRSRYLLPWVREFLADFGPAIALIVMASIAFAQPEGMLEGLPAPQAFSTSSGRSWLVDLGGIPIWAIFAAAVPAFLLSVLSFLGQNITARLMNSPEHKLVRGEAYHWDMAIIGILMGFCSVFGLPWLVGATVRSLNHLRSLATMEKSYDSGLERIIHVQENRLTPLAIHLLMAITLLFLPYLTHIPIALLYGIFVYMGVVSMASNQFLDRLKLWMTDSSMYPQHHYLRTIAMSRIHKFTFIQVACLAVLWMIKNSWSSVVALLFPLFIAFLAPIRIWLEKFFTPEELLALDSAEDLQDDEEQLL